MNSSVKLHQKKLCRHLPPTMDNFMRKHVSPLPPSSDKAKKLTCTVCEMIARDIQPISIVNIGFLNLLKEAEPQYIVPCRTNVTRSLSNLYTSEKRCIRGIVASAEFLCCTTDMWSSRNGDGYITLTSHFIDLDFKMCCIIFRLIVSLEHTSSSSEYCCQRMVY